MPATTIKQAIDVLVEAGFTVIRDMKGELVTIPNDADVAVALLEKAGITATAVRTLFIGKACQAIIINQ